MGSKGRFHFVLIKKRKVIFFLCQRQGPSRKGIFDIGRGKMCWSDLLKRLSSMAMWCTSRGVGFDGEHGKSSLVIDSRAESMGINAGK